MTDDYEYVDELPRPQESIAPADLELLKLAARAIGAARVEVVEGENWVNLHFDDKPTLFNWNPLVHGDDALYLAVTVGIVIRPYGNHHQGSQVVACVHPFVEEREYAADYNHDLRIATCRVIVSAAAEVGKQRS